MIRPPAPCPTAQRLFTRLLLLALLLLPILVLSRPAPLRAAPDADPDPLDLTARAAIVVEYPSGRVLYAMNEHKRLPMASTTKTMTALLTLQRVSVTDVVTAAAGDLVGESTMGLVEGEQQTVHNMLYGLMLPSGNDAAMALARYVGSGLTEPADAKPIARFIALMNRQAQQMGLTDTHFINPHGFDDPNHYSSAYDLASITWYDLHNPVFNEVIRQVYEDVPGHSLRNTNEMLTRYDGADGVKTGWTDEAGLCLVASATRDGRRLIAVVLNAPRWWSDATKLLDYGFAHPASETNETLTIVRRAQLLWFLARDLPTPLPTPYPTATPGATAPSQGAGRPAFLGPNDDPVGAPLPAADAMAGAHGTAPTPQLLPILSLLAVPLGALLLFAYLRLGPRRRAVTAGAQGSPRATSPALVPPRLNLLNDADPRTHAERAIALAYRGQEGSSLAEFLAVVKRAPEFEFGSLAGFYDMPAGGYLALARAYLAADRPRYAVALLQLGLETYPTDRALARMRADLDGPPPQVPAA